MSVFGDNPVWFDTWIELEALTGRFGFNLQEQVLMGDVTGSDLWRDRQDVPKLMGEAETCFLERLVF